MGCLNGPHAAQPHTHAFTPPRAARDPRATCDTWHVWPLARGRWSVVLQMPHLKELSGPWFSATFDPAKDVALAAKAALASPTLHHHLAPAPVRRGHALGALCPWAALHLCFQHTTRPRAVCRTNETRPRCLPLALTCRLTPALCTARRNRWPILQPMGVAGQGVPD